MSAGLRLLASISENGSTTSLRILDRNFLVDEDERSVYDFITSHYRRYNELPVISTVEEETGVRLPGSPEHVDYYIQEVHNRHVYGLVRDEFSVLRNHISSTDIPGILTSANVIRTACTPFTGQQQELYGINALAPELKDLYEYNHNNPGITGVATGWGYLDEQTGGWQNGDLVVWVARPSIGKAQPLYSNVKTIDGWKLMGDIQVGDILASPDGQPSQVTGVYPQKGVRPVYEFTFQDGRKTRADVNHLWRVSCSRWKEPKILTTKEVIAYNDKVRYKGRLGVDLCTGDFGREYEYLIHPYVLGSLLGDGCLVSNDIRFSTEDKYLVEELGRLIPGTLRKIKGRSCDYSIIQWRALKPFLEHYKILGLKSHNKFIPNVYMNGTKKDRLSVLQGLMDTDGHISPIGHSEFCSVSLQLATQVVELVRSLGGKAKLTNRKIYNGHRQAYRVSIWSTGIALFRLPRKASRLKLPKNTNIDRITITDVQYIADEHTQCISVSHHCSLYITDEYVVTHNTWISIHQAVTAWLSGKSVLYVSMEMTLMQIGMRMASYLANLDPDKVRKGKLSNWGKRRLDAALAMMEESNTFNLYAGNFNKTTADVEMLILELGPDVVFIDGMYLMKSAKQGRMGRYETAAYVLDELKRTTLMVDRPIIATTQFGRGAESGGKKGSLENIGYTDAISTHASIILAIKYGKEHSLPIRSEEFDQSSGEFRSRIVGYKKHYPHRHVELMKGREGEAGEFGINFAFASTNFSTVPLHVALGEEEVQDTDTPNLDYM